MDAVVCACVREKSCNKSHPRPLFQFRFCVSMNKDDVFVRVSYAINAKQRFENPSPGLMSTAVTRPHLKQAPPHATFPWWARSAATAIKPLVCKPARSLGTWICKVERWQDEDREVVTSLRNLPLGLFPLSFLILRAGAAA